MTYRKKLIEVALPLEEINAASAREKSIRHGHPSTLHLWWARRPLATCRAVIFSQIVDDPGEEGAPEAYLRRIDELSMHSKYRHLAAEDPVDAEGKPLKGEAAKREKLARERRFRLFTLIEQLVQWENTTNEDVLEPARELIRLACDGNPPPLHDPFCGGGSIPLEAQRLGLEALGSDLNPVAVLITKAMIEIPPKFAGLPPVNPEARAGLGTKTWKGAQGLAEDVRYYGKWMRDEAERRIGHLYPKVKAIRNSDGTYRHATEEEIQNPKSKIENLTVIAWLWARTVKSPNPAFRDVDVPLASTFMLSTKSGKEAYVEPMIEGGTYRFVVHTGRPRDAEAAKAGTKLGRGSNFRCVMSGSPVSGDYVKAEGQAKRMGARLMAIVAEGERGRVYFSPTPDHEQVAHEADPSWKPEGDVPARLTGGTCVPYGLSSWGDLFTDRQLVALTTFSDLVQEAMEKVEQDALAAGMPADPTPLSDGGTGATAYGQALTMYLSFALSKVANIGSSLASWMSDRGAFRETFARQAIPMVWDYAEANPLTDAGGSLASALEKGSMVLDAFPANETAHAVQADASTQTVSHNKIICTDPPYYDNIGYADLSDFFYVWLRRTLGGVLPDLFATVAVPKLEELVATPYRHGGKREAEEFFLAGMSQVMEGLSKRAASGFPVTIFYAFKQSETDQEGSSSSTGWVTFLEAVIRSGLAIDGTWPVRTEGSGRIIAKETNALASSIVIVCRPIASTAGSITRREFQDELRRVLPGALQKLTQANVAPVDLAQASIGPGMEVFTRYAEVLEATGEKMTVKTALQLINGVLDEVLEAQEGWYDDETRFAVRWFAQNGFKDGPYGDADNLARARGTAPDALVDFGFARSGGGRFKLLSRDELNPDYDPAADRRTAIWEACQYLGRALDQGGEDGAARLMRHFRETKPELDIDRARELAYRLYAICDRKKWAAEAQIYNALVTTWSDIETKSQSDAASWIGAGESTQPGGQRELGV